MRAATLLCGIVLLSGFDVAQADAGHGASHHFPDHRHAPRYRLVEAPGTAPINANAINNFGTIVGNSVFSEGTFIWRKGTLTKLPETETLVPVGVTSINDRGTVVGYATGTESGPAPFLGAFIWNRQGYTLLEDLPGGETLSVAADINNRGQVVGASFGAEGYEAVLWEDGTVTSLVDSTSGLVRTQATAINDRGVVVGWGFKGNFSRPFLWSEGQLEELPVPSDTVIADANDVNNFNVAAGSVGQGDRTVAALWRNGALRPLPFFDPEVYTEAHALSINDLGDVVGFSVIQEVGIFTATLWHHGKAYNVNDLVADDDPLKACVTLDFALSINERGQIAAHGFNACKGVGSSLYRLEPTRARH